MSCFKKNDVVYVNWVPPVPSWDEVLLDLALTTFLSLCCWVARLLEVIATPRSELSTSESLVKGLASFLLVWSLACICNDQTKEETALVIRRVIRPVLSPVLASSRSQLHCLFHVLVIVMTAPFVMIVKVVAAVKSSLCQTLTPMSNAWTSLWSFASSVASFEETDNELVFVLRTLLASCYVVYYVAGLQVVELVLYGPSMFDVWVFVRYWWTRAVGEVRGWVRGPQPLPPSVTIRRRIPPHTTTEKPTAQTSEQGLLVSVEQPREFGLPTPPQFRVRGTPWRHFLPGRPVGTLNVSSAQASHTEWRRRLVPGNHHSSRPTSRVPAPRFPSPPPSAPVQLASPPPPLLRQPPPQALLVGSGARATSSSSDTGLVHAKTAQRYKDRPRSKYFRAPRYDLVKFN
ncbi:hypothetical protein ABW21_db0201339 [Orbilia brochopaga]|nr:hypothetical protein ABW21_db0201339 [Drechslerella brochopaga]